MGEPRLNTIKCKSNPTKHSKPIQFYGFPYIAASLKKLVIISALKIQELLILKDFLIKRGKMLKKKYDL